MSRTRRSTARRPFSRADQRSANISHRQNCSMWTGTPCCATFACKQQVEFALTTSSRSRAVAVLDAAHAKSRSASPQTVGWHRERARPATSRSRENVPGGSNLGQGGSSGWGVRGGRKKGRVNNKTLLGPSSPGLRGGHVGPRRAAPCPGGVARPPQARGEKGQEGALGAARAPPRVGGRRGE